VLAILASDLACELLTELSADGWGVPVLRWHHPPRFAGWRRRCRPGVGPEYGRMATRSRRADLRCQDKGAIQCPLRTVRRTDSTVRPK
jgi:hypothetical protein